MNALSTPFKQLFERKLWPIALVMVAALAAVPFALGKSGDSSAPPATAVASTTADQGETQPIVSAGPVAAHDTARKVLGSRKNPFRPAIAAKKAKVAKVDGGPPPVAPTPVPTSTPSAPTGGTPVTPSNPGVVGPQLPVKTYELYSLIVRFGDSSAPELPLRDVKRLKGLPGGASPKLVYLGLLADHKTAVFLVDAAAKVQGDGHCEPSPEDCQTLRMKAGDTVFVDVGEGAQAKQYELDLVKVVTKKTTQEATAVAARTAVAKGGREALHANIGRVGRYRYSSRAGVLKVISVKAWKAAVAKAAAAQAAAAAATPAAG